MMSRIFNIVCAVCCVVSGVSIAQDWYAGKPADWFVWTSAIYGSVLVLLWCVRDAIRGDW